MRSQLYMVSVLLVLVGCAGDPEGRASSLAPKDDDGKAFRPYDDEPPELPDAGGALPDASTGAPDAYAPPPDASGEAPDASQAAPDAATGPKVDAGPPVALLGAWRVTLAPVGMPCGGAARRVEDWQVDPTETTVSTPLGTLARVGGGFEGVLAFDVLTPGGAWAVTVALELGAELGGTYARKGPSCSDRWTLVGVRP